MHQQAFKAEIFALVCAVETPAENPSVCGTWTTGSGTGSDVDDT